MRLNYYRPPANATELQGCPKTEECGYKLSTVKTLIKKYGGVGYSRHKCRLHCDSDGLVQGSSPITVCGNNAVRMSNCKQANYTS